MLRTYHKNQKAAHCTSDKSSKDRNQCGNLMGIVGMLIFIPLVSVLYTIFREFVYLRLKEKHIKQVTKTAVEEYTAEEIVNIDGKCKKE